MSDPRVTFAVAPDGTLTWTAPMPDLPPGVSEAEYVALVERELARELARELLARLFFGAPSRETPRGVLS